MITTKKSVLITGTSAGGIGAALAQSFHDRGFLVFATARDTNKLPAELLARTDVESLALDVTEPASIAHAVKAVRARTAGAGLDVLVNNSGVGLVAAGLDMDIDAGKRLFDVNFWAPLAMMQAFAPLLVQAKGTVVNISSVVERTHIPWFSAYCASKAALSNAGETWRLELEPLGVKVMTVNAGAVKTKFHTNQPEPHVPDGSYYKSVERILREYTLGSARTQDGPADVFADAVVADVLAGSTGKLWRGNLALTVRLVSMLPTFVTDRIWAREGRLGEVRGLIRVD